jgi:hypothetical protein
MVNDGSGFSAQAQAKLNFWSGMRRERRAHKNKMPDSTQGKFAKFFSGKT